MRTDGPVARALGAWRQAERALAKAQPGSAACVVAGRRLETARVAYATAVEGQYDLSAELNDLSADDESYRWLAATALDFGRPRAQAEAPALTPTSRGKRSAGE